MYDNLNIVFKHTTKHLSWIYEHFPTIANIIVDEDYHEKKPHACRWKCGKTLPVTTYHKRLDRKMPNAICWIPYDYHHAFKEFKLISLFFRHIGWGSSIVRHQPKKAVCQKIAENLEHMVNMRMVTVGTNAYAITEHYLTLSKVVIEQGNVYVCSRQRRDTQDKSHGGLGS
ncbi:uncharacterized protein LOC114401516 [Glycine soja]|uniref:uncharacterized protein LOC114401516 n=1 Tax=Glycine soja TaxID=3848 RepID=UPI00103B63FE|nr:uncharacterized protein LOC114401516 [Glycine soja]